MTQTANPMLASTLDPDWNAQYKRANVRSVIARCYVAMAEMDFDLREWEKDIHPLKTIDLRGPAVIDIRTAKEWARAI